MGSLEKTLKDESSRLEMALVADKNELEKSLSELKNDIDGGFQDFNDSVENLKRNVKDELQQERNDRLRDRETFYEDMEKSCAALNEKLVIFFQC